MQPILGFLYRDFTIEKTYRFNLLTKALGIFFQITVFYFISKLISDSNYFSFVLIGLMFSRFFQFWLNVFVDNIRQEQYWGTAELIFLSPDNPLKIIFSSISGKFFMLIFELLFFIFLGKFLFRADIFTNLLYLLPFLFIHSLIFAGIGLISGSFIMYFKRGDPVNWLIGISFDLLSGVYFPLKVLPGTLNTLSKILPNTAALNIWRDIFLNNSFPDANKILIHMLWAFVLVIVGIFCFRKSYYWTKMKGELGSY
ncbi:MAG: ABC transporter permease [Endomicrobiales bacterium]|nr:ABC transporter permease [Endomicrobiales bacterium]